MYQHTQTGYPILYLTIILTIFFTTIFLWTQETTLLFYIPVLLILLSFSSLAVTIDKTNLKIKFGIFTKTFPLKEITEAKAVKNKWYYGWGIRFIIKPRMWIYNVSGYDAVEIIMKNGKTYRIGTDEPKKLESELLKQLT